MLTKAEEINAKNVLPAAGVELGSDRRRATDIALSHMYHNGEVEFKFRKGVTPSNRFRSR